MTIFNLIKTKLNELPNDACINLGEETNASGGKLITYRLLFDKKEMGLFDTLEIKVLEAGDKNFIFSTFDKAPTVMNRLKLLVNDLYKIYGEDSSKRGEFSEDDEENLQEGGYWTGRKFMDSGVHDPEVMLRYNEDSGLALTIWT